MCVTQNSRRPASFVAKAEDAGGMVRAIRSDWCISGMGGCISFDLRG